ncbi:nuclear transport factor 2 family protein [Oceanivirga salmonicida]|uniref:nuclear transport factor 2 family protein n=1 Tax=Oceanivirga salmonicida TaxID=1769291 RepID=UPI00082AF46C|nr:nuclear transport factor 2 family protein [Oceanivirga salmonicida]
MKALEVFNTYAKALEQGDFQLVFETLSDNIIWHMGGNGVLSGTVTGKEELAKRIEQFSIRSNNTFRVMTNWAADNDNFVVASVVSVAKRNDNELNMEGIDLFKISENKIVEVWTFAKFQSIEDEFWK